MAKSFTNWKDLEKAMQKEMYTALNEATIKPSKDLNRNIGQFNVSSKVGKTKCNGNSSSTQINVNIENLNNSVICDEETLNDCDNDHEPQEADELWRKFESDIHKNLVDEMRKRFK